MSRRVLFFNYTLKGTDGQVLDASNVGEPLGFLEGAMQIIPNLEVALLKMQNGEKQNVKIKAQDAYGEYSEQMIIQVPKKDVAHLDLEVGSFLRLDMGEQAQIVKVANIAGEIVTLDGNHPLAGQDLEFDVELVSSRLATPEEVEHNHFHGPGGHHH